MKTETLEPITIGASGITTACTEAEVASRRVIQLKNILVPLDFSELSLKALQYAIPFARQFGAKITLLHIIQEPACSVEFSYYPLRPDQLGAIEEQLKGIRNTKIPAELPVDVVVRQDLVFEGILAMARGICADLIITSTHGRTGLTHLMMGSTAENIVRRAPCPVLVVRETEHDFV